MCIRDSSKWENPPGSNSIGTINSKGDVKYVGWIGNMFSDGYNKDFMWTCLLYTSRCV